MFSRLDLLTVRGAEPVESTTYYNVQSIYMMSVDHHRQLVCTGCWFV